MANFNKVILMGNLTRDPELRYTPNGTAVTTFPLAVNRRYKQGDETKEEVCYIDIVVFGKQAESCGQYLGKGKGVIVDGRLQQRRWETGDGQKRSKHEVVAQSIRFLSNAPAARLPDGQGRTGRDGADEGEGSSDDSIAPASSEAVDNDVPF